MKNGKNITPIFEANMEAALRVAGRAKGGVVVTIFCDSAAKYLSESFWSEVYSEAENWP